jgi:hypothetical protein
MIPNKDYIGSLPGAIHDKDGTLTDIMTALGVKVDPISSGIKNDGRLQPPVATFRVGDKEYAIADVIDAVITRLDSGSGDGGGGSGSGITVIECELIADYEAETYALTHADQLKAALDDMTENPAHGFNYAVYFRGNAERSMLGFASVVSYGGQYGNTPYYGFTAINADTVAYRSDIISGGEVKTYYYATSYYSFQATDIDENGTATLVYTGD